MQIFYILKLVELLIIFFSFSQLQPSPPVWLLTSKWQSLRNTRANQVISMDTKCYSTSLVMVTKGMFAEIKMNMWDDSSLAFESLLWWVVVLTWALNTAVTNLTRCLKQQMRLFLVKTVAVFQTQMFRVIREMKSFNFWDISFSILCTVILEKLSRDIKSSRLFTMAVVTLLEVFRVILCLLTKIFQVNFSHGDELSKCVFTHQKLHARQDYRLIIAFKNQQLQS